MKVEVYIHIYKHPFYQNKNILANSKYIDANTL